ncbi:MAG: ureidoglycolate lyase, partial [Flavicella sp.]|nr:ureidoglycolate lyase [Flavicella sp.]
MKLIRFGAVGQEKPGVQLANGKKIDVSGFGSDYNEDFFGNDGIDKLKQWVASNETSCPEIGDEVRLGAPLTRPSKIVCVGLNYAQHAAEAGMEVPKEPVLFFKATS